MLCAIRRRDEQPQVIREDQFLKEFITEYESLYGIQDVMRRRIHNTFAQGIAVNQRKKIYDAVYRIEKERMRRANGVLYEY